LHKLDGYMTYCAAAVLLEEGDTSGYLLDTSVHCRFVKADAVPLHEAAEVPRTTGRFRATGLV